MLCYYAVELAKEQPNYYYSKGFVVSPMIYRRSFVCFWLHAILVISFAATALRAEDSSAENRFAAENDVTWTSLGKSENDSMPIGNGDFAANVWTESNGDVVLLLSKADAWTETGTLVKLGRIRVKLTPNPFVDATDFRQSLRLKTAGIELDAGENHLRIWADANQSVIHVEGSLARPTTLRTEVEFWRKTQNDSVNWPGKPNPEVMSGEAPPQVAPDVIFPRTTDRIAFCHFNSESYYPYLLRQQHLEALLGKYPDPLLHRCFGVAAFGEGLVSDGELALRSATPSKIADLRIVAFSQKSCDSPKTWLSALDSVIAKAKNADLSANRSAHEKWWREFWNRSWIQVSADPRAAEVSQSYAMQRYMIACSSRGELPPKFNGGLFTVGHDVPADSKQTEGSHNPDYRKWGDCYWNQNTRLLFWPLIATGDLDLLKPWFDMYLNALPLATDRTKTYYRHSGAHFPETMVFWGLPRLQDFGRNNPSYEIKSRWQRYHVQGSLEVIAQMLDVYDQTQDAEFARKSVVPFAEAIVTFYDQHYPRNSAKQITIAPAQSLETYQLVAINPTPDIAGLMHVLPRLLALPPEMTSDAQRTAWKRLLTELPPIPIGKTAKGKLPPLGQGDSDGRPTILPAEQYGKPGNGENPELYVAFPYRLYGVGKPELKLAQDTFDARRSPQNTCWGQDGPQAASLGLASVAQKGAIAYFTNYGDQRFRWFWKSAHDWTPDFDNGGDGMITLQSMLMQCDGRRILLTPAWPKDWTADFKLHAPYQTTVEGRIEDGKIVGLKVTPEARAKDVEIISSE